MPHYDSDATIKNEDLTKLLKDKIVSHVNRVKSDEGFVLHFTDGTTLQCYYSGCEGETAIDKYVVDVSGI